MTLPPRIVLIGPMAAGKSTIGARLAHRLNTEFVDTDQEFERKNGPISVAFTTLGEFVFREMEARIVAKSLTKDSAVISLGGGSVLDAGTQQLLQSEFVVYLETDVDTVKPFIIRDRKRPILQGNDPLAVWESVYNRRRSTYERLATVTVDVSHRGGRQPERVVSRIAELAAEFGDQPSGGTPDTSSDTRTAAGTDA
jgi:shikimate kinase